MMMLMFTRFVLQLLDNCNMLFICIQGGPNPGGEQSGGSGGGKGGKDWWKELLDNQQSILISIAVAAGAGYFLLGGSSSTKEINWQEFRTNYLDRGDVDRLVVSNKSTVKVYLRSDPTTVSFKIL